MGMYTWLFEEDFGRYSRLSDPEMDETYQEVREIFPKLYVSETTWTSKRWFSKPETITQYTAYIRQRDHDSEVRILNMPLNSKELLMNFLFGLLNGHHWTKEEK